ncbi:MAG TPA: metalloregulator ArsR/SmtB family transcription factor [Oligoflexia bacterium]|nr:metalloregulator ArsR/SmtB family transcription factor [Oligoflexia bacterium]HMP48316.1 metalloregulator ArsR/SmtB family transcription factor [Oligoflexia bacterium]
MSVDNKYPTRQILENAAECLRVLGHPARLHMLHLLREKNRTVGQLADLAGIKNNVASEHLRLMQRCGFLSSKKDGTQVHYSISETHIFDILDCIRKRFS